MRRISTAFAGGFGRTREEACGALSAGVIIIGALHGRSGLEKSATQCFNLVERYRDRFIWELGATRCRDLRESGYGSPVKPCVTIVERATQVLLDILAEYGQGEQST